MAACPLELIKNFYTNTFEMEIQHAFGHFGRFQQLMYRSLVLTLYATGCAVPLLNTEVIDPFSVIRETAVNLPRLLFTFGLFSWVKVFVEFWLTTEGDPIRITPLHTV